MTFFFNILQYAECCNNIFCDFFFVAENYVLKLTFFLDKKILTKVISLQLFFYCKMRFSSTQILSPKPAIHAAGQSQPAVTLQLHGVKLAITCNPFLIIQQLSVINRHIMLSVAVCIDKNSHLTITFALSNLPVLQKYNQNATTQLSQVTSNCAHSD